MKPENCSLLKWFFLLTVLMLLVAGCGGSGSSTSNDGTGSLTAKLVWGSGSVSSQAKDAPKVLLLPGVVTTIRIIVSGADITPSIQQDFPVATNPTGGTMTGIPAGSSRTVTVQGLDVAGLIAYQGVKTGITILPGQVNDAGTITLQPSSPVTTASVDTGSYGSVQSVNLTSDPLAIIYYTTNGVDPTTSTLTKGTGSVLNIPIPVTTTLKYFATLTGITPEAIKSKIYTITGSLTVTVN